MLTSVGARFTTPSMIIGFRLLVKCKVAFVRTKI